ncbi:MAG TPA: flavin reductase family protein [Xanthobacteraceae bacterium]|nr:flavin reductase family protein [Xanthobacteraceae bacterium]
MDIDAAGLSAEQAYRLLTGVVVPRPVAWVSTLSPDGILNLAPFSHFTFVSAKPPMLAVSMGRKGATYKDTANNILATGEFVVNIADMALLNEVHESAVEHPPEVSEAELLGLETVESLSVKPPGIRRCPVQMECRLDQHLQFGARNTYLMIGEVLRFRIRDGLMRNGKIETAELKPVARLGGPNYATLGEIVTLRPLERSEKR